MVTRHPVLRWPRVRQVIDQFADEDRAAINIACEKAMPLFSLKTPKRETARY